MGRAARHPPFSPLGLSEAPHAVARLAAAVLASALASVRRGPGDGFGGRLTGRQRARAEQAYRDDLRFLLAPSGPWADARHQWLALTGRDVAYGDAACLLAARRLAARPHLADA